MRSIRSPITPAAFITACLFLAGCLLLASCDYWHNLVDEKTVTLLPLNILVQDAWTGNSLPQAKCSDSARALDWHTDDLGRINLNQAATGRYHLVCSTAGYYDGSDTFDVADGSAGDITIKMARMGKQDWYPDDPSKQVSLQLSATNFRVPQKISLTAAPYDTTGVFTYAWKFSSHPKLNRTSASPGAQKPYLSVQIDSLDTARGNAVDTLADSLSVTVTAHLAGRNYEVGTFSEPVTWVRNKHPSLSIFNAHEFNQVGCEAQEDQIPIIYSASDSDKSGKCDSVVFSSDDSKSSLVGLHQKDLCQEKYVEWIPLSNPFLKVPRQGLDSSLAQVNHLRVTVWDDNRQTHDTVITFDTHSNILPKISISKSDGFQKYFKDSQVNFQVQSSDADSKLSLISIAWGDGSPNRDIGYSNATPIDSASFPIGHTYLDTGTFHVTASVKDGCGETVKYNLLAPIVVQADAPPKIQVENRNYLAFDSTYALDLIVIDPDFESGQDSLSTLTVNWGDGKSDRVQTGIVKLNNRMKFNHAYSKADTNATYLLRIEATDANNGRADTAMTVPRYQP